MTVPSTVSVSPPVSPPASPPASLTINLSADSATGTDAPDAPDFSTLLAALAGRPGATPGQPAKPTGQSVAPDSPAVEFGAAASGVIPDESAPAPGTSKQDPAPEPPAHDAPKHDDGADPALPALAVLSAVIPITPAAVPATPQSASGTAAIATAATGPADHGATPPVAAAGRTGATQRPVAADARLERVEPSTAGQTRSAARHASQAPAVAQPTSAPAQSSTPTTPAPIASAAQPTPTAPLAQTALLAQPAPLAQTAPLAQPAPTAPAAPSPSATPPAPVAQPQLTEALARLRSRGDGNHELAVALHPAELGAVHVRATLHDGTLTVTVACADDAARQAVSAALPDLHHALGGVGIDGGMASIDLDLRDAGHGRHDHPTPADPDQRDGRDQSGSSDPDGRHRPRASRPNDDGLDRWM